MAWCSSALLHLLLLHPRSFLTYPSSVHGNLWIAMWGAHSVMCFDSTGKQTKTIKFTAKNMACTTFGGPHYDELYIASARDRSATAAADDDGGQIFRYKVGVKGLPKYEFAG